MARIPMLWLAAVLLGGPAGADDRSKFDFFESKIRPVLVERCEQCHSARTAKPKGGLRLDTREALRRGGVGGPAVVPGKPDESLLVRAIEHADDVSPMPPKDKLSPAATADFRRWVLDGAFDPREEGKPAVATSSGETWWSLRPIVLAEAPRIEGASNPIDAFVLAKLKAAGLRPNPKADKRTLIRRLSVDLLGLPPSPEEIDAFLDDERPDAYERLVDRLLASAHYGERSARRWMDLVHFAETHGHDQDRIRENAWPYRDYLIDAFNRDVPYPRFIKEQVAADAIFPDRPDLTPALGMLSAGPWDESSLRDIREDTLDRAFGRYLDRDDMLTTVMSTFTSMTVGCARCHDHKFDPIPQSDYYALQAVFAGIDRGEKSYDPDPATTRRRDELTRRREALARRDPAEVERLLSAESETKVRAWRSRYASNAPIWTVLDPENFESDGGATLTEEADHSIVSSGKHPNRETVTLRSEVGPGRITALRLELLPDDRLPNRGPGRNANGNLHLTEIEVSADGKSAKLPINTAISDYDQPDWGVAKAIDGDERTAWGIYPQVGKSHVAVFTFANDVEARTITVVLRQTFPERHAIGRFRLSTTTSERPVAISILPDAVASAVAVDETKRTRTQRVELAAYVVGLEIDQALAELPARRLVYAGSADFKVDGSHKPAGGPRPVNILRRGDIRNPGRLADPGTLSCVAGLNASFASTKDGPEGSRRKALAEWIADPANPLTWRSIVNRVWKQHFGRGLVDTPNDFGRMGETPSHPELLDRLAADFRGSGGSLKTLHRRILTSDAYQRTSTHDAACASIDADDRLLWRANRRRLDAETVRDAVLAASGGLDRAMGGPSVRQFGLSAGVHVTPVVDYDKYRWDVPGAGRRSVYRFLFRTLPDPFMDALDAADASQLVASRNESLTALQALALLNNRFVLHWSEVAAKPLSGRPPDEVVATLFRNILGRLPDAEEARAWAEFARRREAAETARLLFNTNEFLFVD